MHINYTHLTEIIHCEIGNSGCKNETHLEYMCIQNKSDDIYL